MMYVRLVYEKPKYVRDDKKSNVIFYHLWSFEWLVRFFLLIVLWYIIIVW